MYSGSTHLTVREAIQPRAIHRIQSSTKLNSGIFNTSVYDTRQFKSVFLLTDISRISGEATTLDIQLQTSPDNVTFYPIINATQRTSSMVSSYYELLSGYISEFTRFRFDVKTSGGIWTQVDANFIR